MGANLPLTDIYTISLFTILHLCKFPFNRTFRNSLQHIFDWSRKFPPSFFKFRAAREPKSCAQRQPDSRTFSIIFKNNSWLWRPFFAQFAPYFRAVREPDSRIVWPFWRRSSHMYKGLENLITQEFIFTGAYFWSVKISPRKNFFLRTSWKFWTQKFVRSFDLAVAVRNSDTS